MPLPETLQQQGQKMTVNEYIKQSARTDAPCTVSTAQTAISRLDLLHASIGICTEAGEILDALKKNIYYGRALDVVNISEEVGDVMWYIAKLCRDLDLDFDKILDQNIAKLKIRYAEKFTDLEATSRDLIAERDVLTTHSTRKG